MDKTAQQDTPRLHSGGTTSDPKNPTFKIGILKGKLSQAPDFLEPMDADDLAVWEGLEQR